MTTKELLIKNLQIIQAKHRADKEPFKAVAYAKAITSIKEFTGEFTIDNLATLKGVGKSILEKIKEQFVTGDIHEAEEAKQNPSTNAKELLSTIHGIGPVKASELVKKGITTLEQLRKVATSELNDIQRLGLKYYEFIQKRIPRDIMNKHKEFLETYLCPEWETEIMGSYRRGKADSGDIDALMVNRKNKTHKESIAEFKGYIESLRALGYIKATLAEGEKKFMGIVKLDKDSDYRRLDLMLTTPVEYPFALLYFTGSDDFNKTMRVNALKLGYTLNEHALTPIKTDIPQPPVMYTEKEVFKFLKMEWKEPIER